MYNATLNITSQVINTILDWDGDLVNGTLNVSSHSYSCTMSQMWLPGAQGIQGIQGETGPIGLTGPQGPQGETGPAGATGPQGVKGDDGDQGLQGIQGIKGDKGDTGATGIQGIKGDTGNTGPQGVKGDKGDQGIQGIAGTNGQDGSDGQDGAIGPQGETGQTGATGLKGDTGNTGPIGLTGPQGIQGEIGPQGIQGPAGADGNDGADANLGGANTQVIYNDNGAAAGDDGLVFDKTLNNLTIDKPGNSTGIGEGGIFFKNNNATGTSRYHFGIDDYDIFRIKRDGDTTGDGDVWSLVNLESPQSNNAASDNEATLALTPLATSTNLKALDIYYDRYSRDNGAGMRLFTKGTEFDPLRFEQHDKTTSNGQWRFDDCYGTIGTFTVDVFDQATISSGQLPPQVDDWIWDNALAAFPDDTKITNVAVNGSGYTLTINRALLSTISGGSFRGKNIHEYFRLTPDRQLLVRKFIAENSTNVAEFGGDTFTDGDVDITGQFKVNGTPISTNGGIDTSGTPSSGQLAIFTDSDTVEGIPELNATNTVLNTPKLVRINADSGNPEFDFLENGTKRAAVYYNVGSNQLVFQNNESNAIDSVWITENTKISGQLNMDSNKIVGVTDPTNDQDAATKMYVDGIAFPYTTGNEEDKDTPRWDAATSKYIAARRRTPPKLPLPTGYYGIPGLVTPTSRSTLAQTVNRLYYSPFFVHEDTDVTSARVLVSTLGTTALIRVGICEWNDDTGEGGNLVADFGTQSGATTGAKDFTGTATLQGGKWYAIMNITTGVGCTLARVAAATAGDARMIASGNNWNFIDYRYKSAAQTTQGVNGFDANQSGALLTASSATAGVMFFALLKY